MLSATVAFPTDRVDQVLATLRHDDVLDSVHGCGFVPIVLVTGAMTKSDAPTLIAGLRKFNLDTERGHSTDEHMSVPNQTLSCSLHSVWLTHVCTVRPVAATCSGRCRMRTGSPTPRC